MTILVGTASWTDPTLIACKRFYPRGCYSAEARLRHYARTFPLVEVDAAYYAVPDPITAAAWTMPRKGGKEARIWVNRRSTASPSVTSQTAPSTSTP